MGAVPRVLLIDAQSQLLTLLEGKFEREGFEVVSTTSGEEGLALAGSERPDLIVLEARLRDGSGTLISERLKEDDLLRAIPLILLTLRTEASRADGEAGTEIELQHPFSPRRLVELALESL